MGSAEAAELTKLAETTYRDVNIALRQRVRPVRRPRGIDVSAGDRRRQLASPSATSTGPGSRVGGPLHPGLPALLPRGRPRRPPAAALARRQRGDAGVRRRPARATRSAAPGRRARADPRRRLPRRRQGDRVLRRVPGARRAGARRGAVALATDPLYSDAANCGALGFDAVGRRAGRRRGRPGRPREYARLDPGRLPGARALVDGRGVLDRRVRAGRGVRLGRPAG